MLSSVSNFMVGLFGSRNQRLLKRYGVLVAAAKATWITLNEVGPA